MREQDKSKKELIGKLQELRQENNILKALHDKDIAEYKPAKQELIIANKELVFKTKRKKNM